MASHAELQAFLSREFPQTKCRLEAVGGHAARVRHPVGETELRPGGTVSGPVLMAVADVALYLAILGEIGIVPLTVTTDLSIHFLRKPAADRDVVGDCRLLRLGRTLAVGEVHLYSDGLPDPVAHAVGTYAIPPSSAG